MLYACMYVYILTYTYIHTYVCMYACMHTYRHVFTPCPYPCESFRGWRCRLSVPLYEVWVRLPTFSWRRSPGLISWAFPSVHWSAPVWVRLKKKHKIFSRFFKSLICPFVRASWGFRIEVCAWCARDCVHACAYLPCVRSTPVYVCMYVCMYLRMYDTYLW